MHLKWENDEDFQALIHSPQFPDLPLITDFAHKCQIDSVDSYWYLFDYIRVRHSQIKSTESMADFD